MRTGKSLARLPLLGGANAALGLITLTSTHNGSSNFIIVGYQADGRYNGLIVNEIGSYSGTDLIDTGTSVLDITADGFWTLNAP